MNYEYYKLCPKCRKRTIKAEDDFCWMCKPKKHHINPTKEFERLLNRKAKRNK